MRPDVDAREVGPTPCLLFPELLLQGGGLARAITERASLYARHHRHVLILTTGFAPAEDEVVAGLRARGSLDHRVVVRNFFSGSGWTGRLGSPPDEAMRRRPDGIVSTLEGLPGRAPMRIADRRAGARHPFGYRYFDTDGNPVATTRTAFDRKHERTVTFPGRRPRTVLWGTVLGRWIDEELADLADPVLFSMQREFTDPALLAASAPSRKVVSLHNCHLIDPEVRRSGTLGTFRPVLSPFHGIDEVVCLTEEQRADLVQDAPGVPVRAIRYPGRPPHGDAPAKDPDLVVLVAQLIERKRVDHAIRAFEQVVRRLPRVRLEIYGEGVARRRLQALIAELGLQRSVRLMGYSLEVGTAQARAACTLMTSTYEGYARVIGESLVRGTPVVAYDVRYGPRDLIRHGIDGLLVERHEPDALADAIVELVEDPARAAEMGRRGREILDRLPVEHFESAWLDVLRGTRRPGRWDAPSVLRYAGHLVWPAHRTGQVRRRLTRLQRAASTEPGP